MMATVLRANARPSERAEVYRPCGKRSLHQKQLDILRAFPTSRGHLISSQASSLSVSFDTWVALKEVSRVVFLFQCDQLLVLCCSIEGLDAFAFIFRQVVDVHRIGGKWAHDVPEFTRPPDMLF